MKSSMASYWYSDRSNYENDESDTSLAPSSSPPPVREDGFQYDVFLSFRGSDTRKGFTGHLYQALQDKGIYTFTDSEKLKTGQKVEELFGYIERSKIFVPIFSKGYADSQWCLKEITKIVECKRLIIPVFFDLEPRDVRLQTGPFATAFTSYCENGRMDGAEVRKWKDALTRAGEVSGYNLANTYGNEAKLIKLIVKRILTEVNKLPLFVAKHPVGLDTCIADMLKVLELEVRDDVRMIGIHAMGGMGKTTLAKSVYNQISPSFDACSFISNVREAAKESSSLISIQKQLLHDVFEDDVKVNSVDHGIGIIKQRMKSKKVLLVLDDVDSELQLDALAGSKDWFLSGSRIIVTTRDKRVLRLPRWKHNNYLYELKNLDATQSLQLFSWHAFGKEVPDTELAYLSKEVSSMAAGLPLALEVFGSHFFYLETNEERENMLKKLKKDQHKDIHAKLKISYDALEEDEKEIFLDIACFFIGEGREFSTIMWEACGFFPYITIKVLMSKSLISINDLTEQFEMHDHIRDMGRKIVEDENRSNPGLRSRLWKQNDIVQVLQNKRGTENIEAIQLSSSKGEGLLHVDAKSFAGTGLRMLQLRHDVILEGDLQHFPRMLIWLEWRIPRHLESLPDSLHLENIVVLDLSQSAITQVWNQHGSLEAKVSVHLKVLCLKYCYNLTICPDFISMPHLEKLDFQGCRKMEKLDRSIGHLMRLTHLCLRDCILLEGLPEEIWELTSLEKLDLSGCNRITCLPSQAVDSSSPKQLLLDKLKVLNLSGCPNFTICPNFMSMPQLEVLDLGGCKLMSELHPSFGHLKSLVHLSLTGCTSLKELPIGVRQTSSEKLGHNFCSQITTSRSQFSNFNSLELPLFNKVKGITFRGCKNLTICPDFTSMPHLETLALNGCKKIAKLHPSIGHIKSLTHLYLNCCEMLRELPKEIWQLTSLEIFSLSGCRLITNLPSPLGESETSLKQPVLDNLKYLFFNGCTNFAICPDFTCMPHLEVLDFCGCEKMNELHPSIGCLKNLRHLDLAGCKSLKGQCVDVLQHTPLEYLSLNYCPQIRSLPSQMGFFKSLKWLELMNTSIMVLPLFVGHLKQLNNLYLSGCSLLKEIPECICSLLNLERLLVKECERLVGLPDSIGNLTNLRELDLSWTAIKELPGSIKSLEKLDILSVVGCKQLKFLLAYASMESRLSESDGVSSTGGQIGPSERQRYSIFQFPPSITKLYAQGCYELEMIGDVSNAKRLQELDLSSCQKLVDIPGMEQLKCLRILKLGGCRSLSNSLKQRVQEANFENLFDFSIPGTLGGSSDARSLSFFLPHSFRYGSLYLKLEECGLGSVPVHMDITTDDEQLLFQTSIQPRLWRPSDVFHSLYEVSKVELGGHVKPMRNDAGRRKKMMVMRVSICGSLLLDGYLGSYGSYQDMSYNSTDNRPHDHFRVNFGEPFHQYDGPVCVLRLVSSSPAADR